MLGAQARSLPWPSWPSSSSPASAGGIRPESGLSRCERFVPSARENVHKRKRVSHRSVACCISNSLHRGVQRRAGEPPRARLCERAQARDGDVYPLGAYRPPCFVPSAFPSVPPTPLAPDARNANLSRTRSLQSPRNSSQRTAVQHYALPDRSPNLHTTARARSIPRTRSSRAALFPRLAQCIVRVDLLNPEPAPLPPSARPPRRVSARFGGSPRGRRRRRRSRTRRTESTTWRTSRREREREGEKRERRGRRGSRRHERSAG